MEMLHRHIQGQGIYEDEDRAKKNKAFSQPVPRLADKHRQNQERDQSRFDS